MVDFPWVDNFAAARNASVQAATGDYIFWLDADDHLDEVNRDKLKALFASLTKGRRVALRMKVAACPMVLGMPPPSSITSASFLAWRARPGDTGSTQQILPSLKEAGVEIQAADVIIQHTGYQDPALRGRKLQGDFRLLMMELEEHPDDPFVLFNIGSSLHEQGRQAEALPLLQRSLERSHPKDSIVRKLYALIAMCQQKLSGSESALQVLLRGREVEPEDAELRFLEGMVRRDLGDRPARASRDQRGEGAGQRSGRCDRNPRPPDRSAGQRLRRCGVHGDLRRTLNRNDLSVRTQDPGGVGVFPTASQNVSVQPSRRASLSV